MKLSKIIFSLGISVWLGSLSRFTYVGVRNMCIISCIPNPYRSSMVVAVRDLSDAGPHCHWEEHPGGCLEIRSYLVAKGGYRDAVRQPAAGGAFNFSGLRCNGVECVEERQH